MLDHLAKKIFQTPVVRLCGRTATGEGFQWYLGTPDVWGAAATGALLPADRQYQPSNDICPLLRAALPIHRGNGSLSPKIFLRTNNRLSTNNHQCTHPAHPSTEPTAHNAAMIHTLFETKPILSIMNIVLGTCVGTIPRPKFYVICDENSLLETKLGQL
jgi:hypothetical protein